MKASMAVQAAPCARGPSRRVHTSPNSCLRGVVAALGRGVGQGERGGNGRLVLVVDVIGGGLAVPRTTESGRVGGQRGGVLALERRHSSAGRLVSPAWSESISVCSESISRCLLRQSRLLSRRSSRTPAQRHAATRSAGEQPHSFSCERKPPRRPVAPVPGQRFFLWMTRTPSAGYTIDSCCSSHCTL